MATPNWNLLALGSAFLPGNGPQNLLNLYQQRMSYEDRLKKDQQEEELRKLQLEQAKRANDMAFNDWQARQQAASLLDPNPPSPLLGSNLPLEHRQQQARSLLAPYDQGAMDSLLGNGKSGTFGNTAIWGKDAKGNPVVLQSSSAGGALKVAQTPEGVTLSEPVSWLNAGGSYVPVPTRTAPGNNIKPVSRSLAPEQTPEYLAEKKAAEATGEQMGMLPGKKEALDSVRSAISMLDKGIYAGIWGKYQINAVKAVPGIDKQRVVNTEAFKSYIGNTVIPRLKEFGGNDSNEELKYLQGVMGGDIGMEEESLKQILADVERKIQEGIKRLEAGKPANRPPLSSFGR